MGESTTFSTIERKNHMKSKLSFVKILASSIVFLLLTNQVLRAQTSCSRLDENHFAELLREAARLEQAGDEAAAASLMEQAAQLTAADLEQAIAQPIPDSQRLYCKDNPTVRHIACILRLTARVELTGNSELAAQGMQRAAEGVDFWTTQFAQTIPPVGDELCKDYLACIFKALAQRELIGLAHSEVDDMLWAKANEILEKGCEPCETKWVAVGKVDIQWHTENDDVTISGYAQWENFHLIPHLTELEEKCMHLEFDDRKTFPYACNGGVVTHKGGKIDTRLLMTDGDDTFAKEMVEGNLMICGDNTVAATELRLISYLGFDETGQSAEISLTPYLAAIKGRRPFSVSTNVTNDEVPSYVAKFKFMFYPVSGWETDALFSPYPTQR
ncbi:hypothetical protein MASR2M12_23190 [Bacteroidales bacterium]